jgi:hypothetical protein
VRQPARSQDDNRAYDSVAGRTVAGGTPEWLTPVDGPTRGCLASHVDRALTGADALASPTPSFLLRLRCPICPCGIRSAGTSSLPREVDANSLAPGRQASADGTSGK